MVPQLYKQFQHWGKEGAVWIYSDPHFGDEELRAGVRGRPTDAELIAKINSKVGKKDTFICLGDVGDIECARKIRGYKVLICGNHDVGASNYERQVVVKKFDKQEYSREQAIAAMREMYPNWRVKCFDEGYQFQPPFTYWLIEADNCLFDAVYTGPLMIGEKLLLSHEPLAVDWAYNIHGHVHEHHHRNDKYHFNACAEHIGYTPVHLTNDLLKKGVLAHIPSIHRITIDKATERKRKR